MQESVWLIKSSGRIIGPMPSKMVEDGLRTREFTLMDEISQSCSRWAYICDVPQFAKLAEEIRHKNLKNDGETTRAEQTMTDSQTVSLTGVADPSISDDLTEDITDSNVQDAVFQSFDDIQSKSHSRKIEDVYVYEGDITAQTTAQSSTRWLWVVTIAIIFITLAYVGFHHFIEKPIKSKNSAQAQISSGLQALEVGDYSLALNYLSQAHTIQPKDKSIFLPLALLEIQVGNETVKALRLLDELQNTGVDSKKILAARGLAALKDKDYESAEKLFDKALSLDSLYAPAVINLGATALYKQQPERVRGYLQVAIKDGHNEGITQLMLFEAIFDLFKKNPDKNLMQGALDQLNSVMKKNDSLYREKFVAKIYAMKLLGTEAEITGFLPEFLDFPLLTPEAFKRDLYIHNDRVNWQVYSQWCLEALSDIEPTAYVVASEALCLYNSGDLMSASRKIEDAIAQAPRDKLVHSVYAALLMAMNSPERAYSAIEKAMSLPGDNRLQLPYIVGASVCSLQNKADCSLEYWQKLISVNPDSAIGHSELGSLYLQSNKLTEAQQHINRALALSPKYISALNLKERLIQAQRSSGYE